MAYRSPQDIKQQLAHYVFGVANHFIDSADPATQQALIDAASRFIALANSDAAHTVIPANSGLDLFSQPNQQSLDESTDRRFAHRAWLASWLQKQQHYQHQHMVHLEKALSVAQQHYQQIQATVLREPYRSRLLARCQQSLAHFQQCLDSAHGTSQFTTSWLDRLAHDKISS